MDSWWWGGALERAIRNEFDLKAYALNRIERIMIPLMLMCVLIPLVFTMLGIPVLGFGIVGNLFSLQGAICSPLLGPWWALSVEVWFYVFCGAVLGVWKCRKWLRAISAILLVAVIMAFAQGWFHCLVIWLSGSAVYFILPNGKSIVRLSLASCLGIISIGLSGRFQIPVQIVDIFQGLALCWIIREVVVYEPQGIIPNVINKIGTWMSAPSYSIYLSHMLVMIVLANVIFTPSADATVDRQYMIGKSVFSAFTKVGCFEILMLVGSLVVAIVFGWLVYLVAERPWWKKTKKSSAQRT